MEFTTKPQSLNLQPGTNDTTTHRNWPKLCFCIHLRCSSYTWCVHCSEGCYLVLLLTYVWSRYDRVTCLFENKSLTTRPKCMKAYHHIFFTFLVVMGQMVLVIVSIVMQLPEIQRELRLNSTNPNNFPDVVVTCAKDPIPIFVLSVAYEALVITAACVLGIMSFKYPSNWNESKFISFCTFALLTIWIAFIPSYVTTRFTQEIQNATIAIAVIMSSFAVLSCFFGRKLYIVLFRPNENKRQFTSRYTNRRKLSTVLTMDATFALATPGINSPINPSKSLLGYTFINMYDYILHFTLVSIVTGGYYSPYTDRKF